MAPEILVALITSTAGIVLSVGSVPLNYLIAQRAKRERKQDVMARYHDPLLWSVHDLRSRIRTILEEGFLSKQVVDPGDPAVSAGDAFMSRYSRRHTLFVVAQYLGWVEILRRDVGFLDLGDRQRNRDLIEHLSIIRRVLFAADLDPVLHIPTGQQSAIGEIMIEAGGSETANGWRCIGFATFCARLDTDPVFSQWFDRVVDGLEAYATGLVPGEERLVELNHRLTGLIDFLDPDLTRFPTRHQAESTYRPAVNA
ncbi:hypothetical protein F4553_002142 [Allocatelliglobosispora scoriae]|uniref:Uncharacterized protein n=1 Tax=Allocatelliglobosispora scoriae TaxID=643052 RepID=A0A841BP85_9ACTN|nr:hypothetical protein [Allocatelliglobosispora scoriae]MBB5868763.1 hypothetical protein [Allocatelliglobosispora scoriae]